MKNFWTFYKNIDTLPSPFQVFGISHLVYIILTIAAIYLLFKNYKKCDSDKRHKWQHGIAWYLFIQEMLFYIWTWNGSHEFFEVLQLELCTFCLFVDFSTVFHKNQQVRFFGAVIAFIGAPIALIYPATVSGLYPAVSYRLINFYMTHGAYILFSLMLLQDTELLTAKRMQKNTLILAGTLVAVYFFDLKFGTQYMFVGTPPNIPIIRLLYDIVGQVAFLPIAIVIVSGYHFLIYHLVKKIQQAAYREA